MAELKYVSYEEFGAVGDGIAEDFEAVYKAHVYANESGLPVKARSGAKYYLHSNVIDGEVKTIPIMTDVDWTGVEFIIDDSDIDARTPLGLKMSQAAMFAVLSEYQNVILDKDNAAELLSSLGSVGCDYGTKRIDLGLGYPALLILQSDSNRIYRRYGSDGVRGEGKGVSSATTELVVVDKDGNISPETPFMFNYPEITKIEVVRTDVKPITLKGGLMRTIACDINIRYVNEDGALRHFGYYNRGLLVRRSHTVLDGIYHRVDGEISLERQRAGERGAHYSGFFLNQRADGITLRNCTLQGRRYYHVSGTYDFSGGFVNNIILENCDQRNFWVDEEGNPSDTDTGRLSMEVVEVDGRFPPYCWGTGGTNFCKNMTYKGSRVSRFDAHQGLYNGAAIDCELQAFELIGKGDFIIKNVKWYSYRPNATSVLALRGDYGSTWEGRIFIDGMDLYASSNEMTLVPFHFVNWNFGYVCHVPSVEIKNVRVFDKKTRKPAPQGYPVNIYSTTVAAEPYMHLDVTKKTHPQAIGWNENEKKYMFMPVPERGFVNENPTVPPEYVKLINNEAGYLYRMPKSDDENFFFKNTKFYYNEEDYYLGTNHENAKGFTFE